jgi:RES domain-containing protein
VTFLSSALGTIPPSAYDGHAYRHQGPAYSPTSGEGARRVGGRFNPAGSFPVLYLCETRPCAVAELQRIGRRQAIGLAGLLPRHLYRYRVRLSGVLDLTDDDVLKQLGVDRDVVTGPSWDVTQQIGAAAYRLGWRAVRSPSATGTDHVVAVFPELVGAGTLEPELIEQWEHPDDL